MDRDPRSAHGDATQDSALRDLMRRLVPYFYNQFTRTNQDGAHLVEQASQEKPGRRAVHGADVEVSKQGRLHGVLGQAP